MNKKISTPLAFIIILACAVSAASLAIQQYFYSPKIELSEIILPKKSSPQSETADWNVYRNEKDGFEFRYPQAWLFDVDAEPIGGVYDFLDIHLSNFQRSDNWECDPGFIGLEIQVNHKKDQNQDFRLFVESQLVEGGLGPVGPIIEEMWFGQHRGFRIRFSGWDSSCTGPGYFIERDKDYYVYVFTGTSKDNRNENGISCGFLTGATGVINGKRINYGCSDGSYVLGDLQTGTLWKAEKAQVDKVDSNLQAKSTELVSIRRVWQ